MSEHATIRLTARVLLDGAYRPAGDVVEVRRPVAEDLVRLGGAEHVAAEPIAQPSEGDDPSAGSAPAGGEPRPSDIERGAADAGRPALRDDDPPAQGSGPAGGESSGGTIPRIPDVNLLPAADSPESTTRVKGVGPATATALADAGIYTLADLAALSDDAVAGLATTRAWASGEPGLRAWCEQAAALLAADTARA